MIRDERNRADDVVVQGYVDDSGREEKISKKGGSLVLLFTHERGRDLGAAEGSES